MIYDTLAWFPCFVVTLWTASSLPNSSLHAAFLMTYYNETIHAFIYLPWRVTPAFPYPFHKRESFLNPHGLWDMYLGAKGEADAVAGWVAGELVWPW